MKHYTQRLEERFNLLDFDKKALKKLNLNIQGVDNTIPCMFIKKKSNRVSMWLVLLNNKWVVAYYDKSRNTVVTFVDNYILENFELINQCLNKFNLKKEQ